MAITEIQLQNIRKLSIEDSITLLHECAENLGLISVDQYHNLTNIPKRTIYYHIEIEQLKALDICDRKLIIMNH